MRQNQQTFASLAYTTKKRTTRREKFLSEMDRAIPWSRILSVVSPYYAEIGNGRPPIGLERMLRIYYMQHWFGLSDPGMEDSLYDSESMRRFAGIELGSDVVPDETTICKFRHLLEKHELTSVIFREVDLFLQEKGLILKEGTVVDASLVQAPSSTKNKTKTRDSEMSQTKKGNQWYFGMKMHVGTDAETGLVHTIVCTTASVHDSQEMDELLHGEEKAVYGDKAYASAERKERYERISWWSLRL